MEDKSRAERAKLFAPFAALKGYYELILSEEQVREDRHELCEDDAAALNSRLMKLDKGEYIHLRYYDHFGYADAEGEIMCIDLNTRCLVVDGKRIWFSDIIEICDDIIK